MFSLSRASLGLAVLALAASSARAGEWGSCNGYDIKWRSNIRAIQPHRNRCTIPDSGSKNDMYWHAFDQWQYAGGPAGSFFVRPAEDCQLDRGDNISEIAVVPPSTIDDQFGKTFLRFNSGCSWHTGWWSDPMSIIEADVGIRNDFPRWEDPGEGIDGVQAWDTLIHELGHMFGGLLEDSRWFSIMTVSNNPLVGGTGRHSTIMPRDRYRMNALYGHSGSVVNVAASAQVVKSPYAIGLADPPTLQYVCRGGWVNIGLTLLNQSSGSRVGPFQNRVRLSANFRGHDAEDDSLTFTVAQWEDSLEPWQDKKVPVGFTVPWDFPAGRAMYIYVDVDWWGQVAESREDDNRIQLAKILWMPNVCY